MGCSDLGPVRRSPRERAVVSRIVMDQWVCGIFKPEAVGIFQRVMARMKGQGCDAAVLGCTEIPLVMNDANSPLPTPASTRLPARALHSPAAGV